VSKISTPCSWADTNQSRRIRAYVPLLEVTVGERWSVFVNGGGPVALMVGLDPLPRGAALPQVKAYVAATTLAARLRLGISRLQGAERCGGSPPPTAQPRR
jgi:hypothetical protein